MRISFERLGLKMWVRVPLQSTNLNKQTMENTKLITLAEKWFQLNDMQTSIDKEGNFYVIVYGDVELELSTSEIEYRAELYLESELEDIKS